MTDLSIILNELKHGNSRADAQQARHAIETIKHSKEATQLSLNIA